MEFTMVAIKAAARAYKRRSDPLLSEAGEIIGQCTDTIERLQKEQGQEASKLRGAHDAMEALSKALTKTEQERDAALRWS